MDNQVLKVFQDLRVNRVPKVHKEIKEIRE
jgi:hypothetical protein